MQTTLDADWVGYSELQEILLDRAPEASYNVILSNALRKLKNFVASGDMESAEKIADLFGTSVGKNSAILETHILK